MPPTTSFRFGDIVLVPFPFTDQSGIKKRPAIVVSSAGYQARRRDVIIMAVTSRMRTTPAFGEVEVAEWKKAGLIVPSVPKPVLATVEKRLVIKTLGSLRRADRKALLDSLRAILG
jgi:mRNA interferase MazF